MVGKRGAPACGPDAAHMACVVVLHVDRTTVRSLDLSEPPVLVVRITGLLARIAGFRWSVLVDEVHLCVLEGMRGPAGRCQGYQVSIRVVGVTDLPAIGEDLSCGSSGQVILPLRPLLQRIGHFFNTALRV